MIVCLCHAVSDRALRDAVHAGAGSREEVVQATRAGTECGCCRAELSRVVEAALGSCGHEVPCPGCPRHGGEALRAA